LAILEGSADGYSQSASDAPLRFRGETGILVAASFQFSDGPSGMSVMDERKRGRPSDRRLPLPPLLGGIEGDGSLIINLSLPRVLGVLNFETAISDCPDRTYVLKGSYAVLHR
jgi:hypothetical protein